MDLKALVRAAKRVLPLEHHADLDALASRPELAEMAADAEAATVAERRRLVAELSAIPERARAAVAKTAQRQAEAEARVSAARAELAQALDAQREAIGVSLAASGAMERGLAAIERQLREGGDPRISATIALLQRLRNDVQNGLAFAAARVDGRTITVHNGEELRAAGAAIGDGLARCQALQLAALTSVEVTAALEAIGREVSAALAPVQTVKHGLTIGDDGTPRLAPNLAAQPARVAA